jgi:carboxynorspermidine decarboxylase
MKPAIPADIVTPAYVVDIALLERNLAVAARIRAEAGCRILLATKAFALPAVFPMMAEILDGTTASGEYEARLGREMFRPHASGPVAGGRLPAGESPATSTSAAGSSAAAIRADGPQSPRKQDAGESPDATKEVHVYAPAYAPGEVERLTRISDHIYFNSPSQIARYLPIVKKAGRKVGIRINPGYSNATLGGPLYDPCAPCSRFGTPRDQLDNLPWDEIDILHAHALCESLHDGSVGLIEHVGREFARYIARVKTVNFGGGHFINKPGYDVGKLIDAVRRFRDAHKVDVILEPGAGLVVDAGWLVSTVLDIHHNDKDIAILDTSASTHMPDVLEVPYRPPIVGAAEPGVHSHDYVLGGKTCMTGDVIGEYSFPHPLKPGDRIVFGDMAQYSFVKNTTFNGTPLPDLAILEKDGTYRVIRRFGYEDFARRLGA